MVQNLNILSFAPYGKLLAERSDSAGLPQGEQWEEAPAGGDNPGDIPIPSHRAGIFGL